MSVKRKKNNIDIYVSIAGVLLCIIITSIIKKCNDNTLYSNYATANAVVSKIYTIRYTEHFQYIFTVNGKSFNGDDLYYSKTDCFSVGDTIAIIYNILDPSQNKPILDKFK